MRRNGYLGATDHKCDLIIRSVDLNFFKMGTFPLSDDVCGICFVVFVLNFHVTSDLNLWPFELDGVSYIKLHTSNTHTNFEHPVVYPFPSYGWFNVITLPSHGTVITVSRVMFQVEGAKIIHIFEISDPNLSFHIVTFRALRRRLSHVIGQKLHLSHCEGYKVCCACAVSCELCIGSPRTTHSNFLNPNILFTIQLLWSHTMTIKGSLFFSAPMWKWFSAAKKLYSQNRSPKCRFFGNLVV